MAISEKYFRYMDRYGETRPVRFLSESPDEQDVIALRHDVDHDLDIAMEMAYWESERGLKSTYYMLHTAPYWKDESFVEKCLQIQDFGHEVGVHLNVLTEWFSGAVDDPEARLKEIIRPLMENGVDIVGCSAHGDKVCYSGGFINYWLFTELKPDDPAASESGKSAEGVREGNPEKKIVYPKDEKLTRKDGRVFGLWSVRMADVGLRYEANFVKTGRYFSDSGGGWVRSADPMTEDLSRGRSVVLMHPVHWRAPQRIYFFLSTARSGSKWLANYLDKATPLTVRHEFTLNHRYKSDAPVFEKRTAEGFTSLVERKDEAKELLWEARAWIDDLGKDYAEANVYLERFIPELKEIFPDAVLTHLVRSPADVVTSIMNRDWYDTPEDDRHPVIDASGWEKMGQFEKALWYVKKTNETLMRECDRRITFERMVSDHDYLRDILKSMGIAVFPRLGEAHFAKIINANSARSFPAYGEWGSERKALYHSTLGHVLSRLGYGSRGVLGRLSDHLNSASRRLKLWALNIYRYFSRPEKPVELACMDFRGNRISGCSWDGCDANFVPEGLEIVPWGGRHAYLFLGGSSWHELESGDGWEVKIGIYYRGSVRLSLESGDSAQLFALMYDKNGALAAKRRLGRITMGFNPLFFSFKPRGDTARFNIAVYLSSRALPERLTVEEFNLEMAPSVENA